MTIIQPGNNPLVRDVERLRQINAWLRGEGPAPPDVTEEERAAVGASPPPRTPPALRSPEELDAAWAAEVEATRRAQGPQRVPSTHEEEPVFGLGGKKTAVPLGGGRKVEFKQIKGIDYERGVVQIDNYEYSITEEEKQAVASFAIQVMLRELNIAIAQLMTTSKARLPGVPDARVPQVPAAPPEGGVPEGAMPAVPDAVHEPVEQAGGDGEGAPAPESPRAPKRRRDAVGKPAGTP